MTKRQRVFAAEYIKDHNASRAARVAGYSDKSAHAQGHRLLKHVEVSAFIEQKTAAICEKHDISAEKVLQGLANLAFFDIRTLFNADGSLKKVTEMDSVSAQAVAGFDVEELYEHFGKGAAKQIGLVRKVKLADRGTNLERLGRHLKLFVDRLEHSGLDNIAEEIAKARQRVQS